MMEQENGSSIAILGNKSAQLQEVTLEKKGKKVASAKVKARTERDGCPRNMSTATLVPMCLYTHAIPDVYNV